MSRRDEESHGGGLQAWSTSERNLPMVVLAPPEPEAAATRGVTGVFVLLILITGLFVAVWQFWGAWQAYERYQTMRQITRAAEGLQEYVDDLEEKNRAMTDRRVILPLTPPHPLQVGIADDRAGYDTRCIQAARRQRADRCLLATPCPARPSDAATPPNTLAAVAANRRDAVPICDTYLDERRETPR